MRGLANVGRTTIGLQYLRMSTPGGYPRGICGWVNQNARVDLLTEPGYFMGIILYTTQSIVRFRIRFARPLVENTTTRGTYNWRTRDSAEHTDDMSRVRLVKLTRTDRIHGYKSNNSTLQKPNLPPLPLGTPTMTRAPTLTTYQVLQSPGCISPSYRIVSECSPLPRAGQKFE